MLQIAYPYIQSLGPHNFLAT